MSTDEYSQDLPDEDVYGMQGTSSMSYHNGSSMMMPGNMDMSMMSGSQQQMGQQQQQQHDQRQKRKYTRRKQPEERKKRGPRTKDLNAPRMPLNGYVRYLNANRERLKQDHPELPFAEVTKRLASEWSSMSAEQKKVYLDEAEKAKEVYMKELHDYQQTESYQEFLSMKQRSKQQSNPPMRCVAKSESPAAQSMAQSSSSSTSQMPPAGNMYGSAGQQQQSYYAPEPQTMHPSQYQAMFQQQQQQHHQQQQHQQQLHHQQQQHQYSSYGMDSEGKMMSQQQQHQQQQFMSASLNGPGMPYGQQQHQQLQHHQQQQQQYYQPSSHSSATSEYGMPSQYPATHFHYGSNCPPHNGMPMQPMNVAPNNGSMTDMNGQHLLNHGSSLPGTSTMASILEKSGPVMDLPIFTEEFLDHNKMRDVELRNSRARLLELEEENAILSKHVDDVTTAAEKLISNEAKERETGAHLDSVWEKLQNNLVDHFHDITMPFSDDSQNFNSQCFPPTMDNFDQYVDEFDKFRMEALGNDPQHRVTEPKYEQHVQSIEAAVKALDAGVTF